MPELIPKVTELLGKRENVDVLGALWRSCLCGFLMTTAVCFGRKSLWLPLIWAVPVFILAGFYHSIADCFYVVLRGQGDLGYGYFWEILGNFIGCNLYRLKMD